MRDFYKRNISYKALLRCLAIYQYYLTAIQLRNLRLHSSTWLLMGTAHTNIAYQKAQETAEEYVRNQLLSGQAIQFGRTYTTTNIRMEGVFISQLVYFKLSKSGRH